MGTVLTRYVTIQSIVSSILQESADEVNERISGGIRGGILVVVSWWVPLTDGMLYVLDFSALSGDLFAAL